MSSSRSHSRQPSKAEENLNVDLGRFSDQNFQPINCNQLANSDLNSILATSSEPAIRLFYEKLISSSETTEQELQQTLAHNYTLFLQLFDVVQLMETEMVSLKTHLDELGGLSNNTEQDDNEEEEVTEETIAHRAVSISELNVKPSRRGTMQAQMNRLYDFIEGLQNALPIKPDRALLKEMKEIEELNAVTLKPKRTVEIYLLSDALVIAKKKRGIKRKVHLLHCWYLSEVAVVDVNEIANAFKLIKYPETFVYRCENVKCKKEYDKAFQIATRSLYVNTVKSVTDIPTTEIRANIGSESSVETSTKQKLSFEELEELEELGYELDVAIAVNEFSNALDFIDKTSEIQQRKILPLKKHMASQTSKLCKRLCDIILSCELSSTNQIQSAMQLLMRLELPELAYTTFLQSRSTLILVRLKDALFMGNVTVHIEQISAVVFTLVQETVERYMQIFTDAHYASECIVWAEDKAKEYTKLFKRHVFRRAFPIDIIAECIQIALSHCEKLRAHGIDFSYLIHDELENDVGLLIEQSVKMSLGNLMATVEHEDWRVEVGAFEDIDWPLSKSVCELITIVNDLLDNSKTLCEFSGPYLKKIIGGIEVMVTKYGNALVEEMTRKLLKPKQMLSMITDLEYVMDTFLVTVEERLKENQSVGIFESARTTLKENESKLHLYFGEKSAMSLANAYFKDFANNQPLPKNMSPSSDIIHSLTFLKSIVKSIRHLPSEKLNVKSTATTILLEFFSQITRGERWTVDGKDRPIGITGVHQLLLDMQFVMDICKDFFTPTTTSLANEVCSRGLSLVIKQHPECKMNLKPGSFYQECIRKARDDLRWFKFEDVE